MMDMDYNAAPPPAGNGESTANSIEDYFSVFKRGIEGIFRHCLGEAEAGSAVMNSR